MEFKASENYSKNKRAALSFSAILVLLSVAATKSPNMNLTGVLVPVLPAMVLIWVASAYYTWGFHVEWKIARSRNSKELAGAQDFWERLLQISAHLAGSHREVLGKIQIIDQNFAILAKTVEENGSKSVAVLAGRINTSFLRSLGNGEVWSDAANTATRPEEISSLLEQVIANQQGSIIEASRNFLASANKSVEELTETVNRVDQNLCDMGKNIRTLHQDFSTHQRFLFNLWDWGATIGLFSFASVSPWAISPLVEFQKGFFRLMN